MEDPAYQTPVNGAPAPRMELPKPPARGKGCFLGFGLGCFVSLLLLIVAPMLAMMGIGMALKDSFTSQVTSWQSESPSLTDQVDDGKIPVLELELKGVITGEWSSPWYTDPASDAAVLEAIQEASKNESVKGLLLKVNSPGGSVTASDNLYHALEVFKQSQPGRKVVVMGGDIVASGAYYLAMQADWIRVQPTTVVGSIGVIMPGVNLSGLATRMGVADNSIASGASKDMGNPLKPVNPEHNAVLKTVVDGMYARFVDLVAKGRKMQMQDVKKVADGRVFTAKDAQNLRLVDDIGYADTLDVKIAELFNCEVDDLYFYENNSEQQMFKAFFSAFPQALGKAFSDTLMQQERSTPQYRW
jgi:protease-4